MNCDHTAGLDVRSELVYDIDDLSNVGAHKYFLTLQSVICKGCGGFFEFGRQSEITLRLSAPAPQIPSPVTPAAITADDFEM